MAEVVSGGRSRALHSPTLSPMVVNQARETLRKPRAYSIGLSLSARIVRYWHERVWQPATANQEDRARWMDTGVSRALLRIIVRTSKRGNTPLIRSAKLYMSPQWPAPLNTFLVIRLSTSSVTLIRCLHRSTRLQRIPISRQNRLSFPLFPVRGEQSFDDLSKPERALSIFRL